MYQQKHMSGSAPVLDGVGRTSEDAARGKLAAVSAGYYSDSFARAFVPEGLAGRSPGPLLNRGHYARVAAVGSICEQFLSAVPLDEAQIISLGAGFDTRFWQLCAIGRRPRLFIEIDQPAVVARKAACIEADPSLMEWLPGMTVEPPRSYQPEPLDSAQSAHQPTATPGEMAAPLTLAPLPLPTLPSVPSARALLGCATSVRSVAGGYFLGTADLRHLPSLEAALSAACWRSDLPTLLLAECVLVYLAPECSESLLSWFGARASSIALALYEQIHPHDPFGKMMLSNLRRRGCPLLGLVGCPDLEAQVARCERSGWRRAEAESVLKLYEGVLSIGERKRLERLEMLDEVEEWRLMLGHYCVLLAIKEDTEEGGEGQLEAMRLRAPIERLFPQESSA